MPEHLKFGSLGAHPQGDVSPKHESTLALMSQLGYIMLSMGIGSYQAYLHKQRGAYEALEYYFGH